MRLISVTIRNYRLHRELAFEPDAARTLIGGPNESGKSTCAEAMHRALFFKAKGNTAEHRAMVSTVHPGQPEVELQFEAGGSLWHLKKRFGGSGATTLATPGKPALSGEAAETELARLLGVEPGASGKAAASQWAHLWVHQGRGADDPMPDANAQQASLLLQLQKSGGAAAMMSERDGQIAARFERLAEETFLKNGKPKAGSPLALAEAAEADAATRLAVARERLEKTRTAAMDVLEAQETIRSSTETIETLKAGQATVEEALARVEELKRTEATQDAHAAAAREKHAALETADGQIRDLETAIAQAAGALAPLRAEAGQSEEALRHAREHHERQQAEYEAAGERTLAARRKRDLTAACAAALEREERLRELREKAGQAAAHGEELRRYREALAGLPEAGSKELEALRKLETAQAAADAALQAMATGLEILAAQGEVLVNGEPLAPGQPRILAEEAELNAGFLRLRIRPGGGTSLAQARRNAFETRRAFRAALDALGLKDLAQAGEAASRRAEIAGKIEILQGKLESLGAPGLPALLAEAEHAFSAAKADAARRAADFPGFAPPQTHAGARTALGECEEALRQAESCELQLKAARDETGRRCAARDETAQRHRAALAESQRRLDDREAQRRLLVEQHGDRNTRAAALGDALNAKTQAAALLAATRGAIKALQPEMLAGDAERLRRALEQARLAQTGAETRRAVAQAALRSDGSEDPEAELAFAKANAGVAGEHLAQVRRKAGAIRCLADWFQEERRALADQFTRPLAEKIAGYLQCLFGPGARANVILSENAFSGLELVRPSWAGGAVPFEQLSGGAREQVAAAVRLAMAEVLSASHGGSLPVVFDDAFAWSDPERVKTLQRMLDLAASRGLQVIVLTCNPSDYSGLGARLVPLRAPESLPAGSIAP